MFILAAVLSKSKEGVTYFLAAVLDWWMLAGIVNTFIEGKV